MAVYQFGSRKYPALAGLRDRIDQAGGPGSTVNE
jgi:hypothetical protein